MDLLENDEFVVGGFDASDEIERSVALVDHFLVSPFDEITELWRPRKHNGSQFSDNSSFILRKTGGQVVGILFDCCVDALYNTLTEYVEYHFVSRVLPCRLTNSTKLICGIWNFNHLEKPISNEKHAQQ